MSNKSQSQCFRIGLGMLPLRKKDPEKFCNKINCPFGKEATYISVEQAKAQHSICLGCGNMLKEAIKLVMVDRALTQNGNRTNLTEESGFLQELQEAVTKRRKFLLIIASRLRERGEKSEIANKMGKHLYGSHACFP